MQQSFVLSTELGDRKAQSSVLTGIGKLYAVLGEHRKAIINCGKGDQVARDAKLLWQAHAACSCL